MKWFETKLKALRDWFERLSSRERAMVGALAVTFVSLVTLVIGYLISDGLSTLAERNAEMRQALRDLDTQRDSYLRAKAKYSQLESRLHGSAPALSGYLEQAAKEAGIQIPESNDRPTVPSGKNYVEHSVDLRLRAVTLDALAKFMKRIETGPNLVVVSALNVRTRDDHHKELDVEMTVATYERAAEKKEKGGGKKGENP